MKKIAIIGAGMSGLSLAKALQDSADVVIFERSQQVGGRMASLHQGKFSFDHGAQFFIAKRPGFQSFLLPYLEAGVVQRWDARFVEIDDRQITLQRQWDEEFPHYVAAPTMNSLCQHLQQGLTIEFNTEVCSIENHQEQWFLTSKEGVVTEKFDWLVFSLPAKQSLNFLPADFAHTDSIQHKLMKSCYSLMIGCNQSLNMDWDAALIRNRDISWISVNSSKPGRPQAFSLVAHSTNAWADDHLNMNDERVKQHLMNEVSTVLQQPIADIEHAFIHRWHYANIGKQQGEPCLIDERLRLAAIGDWCIKGRIESAYYSAIACAKRLRAYIA